MIVVGVGEYNGGGSDPGARLEPIGPAIDHDAGAALSDEERAVAAVAARSCFDLAARAEEGEFDVCAPLAPPAYALVIAIFFSFFCASGDFGKVTVSTPFLKLAAILSGSTLSGTWNERWKDPKRRSDR